MAFSELRQPSLTGLFVQKIEEKILSGSWNGSIYGYRHSQDDNIVARLMMNPKENHIGGLYFAGAHAAFGDGMSTQVLNGQLAASRVVELLK